MKTTCLLIIFVCFHPLLAQSKKDYIVIFFDNLAKKENVSLKSNQFDFFLEKRLIRIDDPKLKTVKYRLTSLQKNKELKYFSEKTENITIEKKLHDSIVQGIESIIEVSSMAEQKSVFFSKEALKEVDGTMILYRIKTSSRTLVFFRKNGFQEEKFKLLDKYISEITKLKSKRPLKGV